MIGLRIALPVLPGATVGNYMDALAALGAEGETTSQLPDPAQYDGLLLPGGWDVDPALYGQQNTACQGVNRQLDALQIEALRRFAGAGRPVLGICRGCQVINVGFGGTLIQHLLQSARHSREEGSSEDRIHPTRAADDSFLDRLYGPAFRVNSSHHQAADEIGEGLLAVQFSDDGVIEGLCHRSLPVWGVQWHPERLAFRHRRPDAVDGAILMKWFLDQCRSAGRGR